MKKLFCQLLALVMLTAMLLGILTGCKRNPRVVFEIENYGKIVMELRPEVAPLTVANFQKLVEEGFYDGLTFHRIDDLTHQGGYIIQGGDPDGDGTGGSGTPIKGEFSSNGVTNNLSHVRGVVSMARTNDPNSATSQFFICAGDCSFLDGNYAAFAVVVRGMRVVDKLAAVRVDENSKPLEEIVITKAYMK